MINTDKYLPKEKIANKAIGQVFHLGGSGGGCWLCQFGWAVLSYLKCKGKEPDEKM